MSGKGISTEYAEKGSAAGENEVDSVLSVKSNSGKIQSESFPDNEADPVDQVAAPPVLLIMRKRNLIMMFLQHYLMLPVKKILLNQILLQELMQV